MKKIDYKKELKQFYKVSSKEVELVEVPAMNYRIIESGYSLSGKHHEIYLSDIRRAAPEKWKTIIRQPYK